MSEPKENTVQTIPAETAQRLLDYSPELGELSLTVPTPDETLAKWQTAFQQQERTTASPPVHLAVHGQNGEVITIHVTEDAEGLRLRASGDGESAAELLHVAGDVREQTSAGFVTVPQGVIDGQGVIAKENIRARQENAGLRSFVGVLGAEIASFLELYADKPQEYSTQAFGLLNRLKTLIDALPPSGASAIPDPQEGGAQP